AVAQHQRRGLVAVEHAGRGVAPQGHDQLHLMVQLVGSGRVGDLAVQDHGIGRLEEEHRRPARGRIRGGGAHLAGVLGEVAADAVDAPDGEAGTGAAHRDAYRDRGGHEVAHRGVHARKGLAQEALPTTRYSASTTRPDCARGLPRWRHSRASRPAAIIAAPTNTLTNTSTASTATPTRPISTRSTTLRRSGVAPKRAKAGRSR